MTEEGGQARDGLSRAPLPPERPPMYSEILWDGLENSPNCWRPTA